ncbi:hypothetical protein FACS1894193_04890 [Bacilli bacterium]|nr:hypothetical protein FACS1894192_07540 [Bacilli bacterium]GHU41291.1 hypothetical protein FACS1894193_04890 [Bacilli bacterium]
MLAKQKLIIDSKSSILFNQIKLAKLLISVIIVKIVVIERREKLNQTTKEKMLEIIKKKQAGGGRSSQETPTKNDRKHMRKGPKIFNK